MSTNYRSPKTLSLFAIGGLATVIFLQAITIIIYVFLASTVDIHPEDLVYNDDPDGINFWLVVSLLLALAQLFVTILTIIFFLVWEFRAASNLPALKADVNEYTPGWAVGWWFVPFANLIKPFHVAREIWCESDPDYEPDAGFLSGGPHTAPTIMVAWWIFWIASNIFFRFTNRITEYSSASLLAESVIGVIYIIAGILLILIVRQISARQDARIKVVDSMTELVVPPPPVFERHDDKVDISQNDTPDQPTS